MDPNLQKNILKFGYGINCKYEGQLSHSTDKFYGVTKFHLLKFSNIAMTPQRRPVDFNNVTFYPHAIT